MDKRVILAVAGAGKTYYICQHIDRKKRSLILAYTNENIENIKKELKNIHGNIPSSTTILTFHSFVYRHFILPYELSIAHHFNQPAFISRGLTTLESPPQLLKESKSEDILTSPCDDQDLILTPNSKPDESNRGSKLEKTFSINPDYKTKEKLEHYTTRQNKYYCSTISELALFVTENKSLGTDKLVARAIDRLKIFFDEIFIDEFQDFRTYDYELLMELADKFPKICLVGDFYQHSVLADNNSGPPFDNLDYEEFIQVLSTKGFNVDTKTLLKSRRCAPEICTFVRDKLNISIYPVEDKTGKVIWVDSSNIEEILENDGILKLVYNNSAKYPFHAMNWSYSKGNTVEEVCVILTNDFEDMDSDKFAIHDKKGVTRNRLYVALTRSSGNLYLIKPSVMSNKDQLCLPFDDENKTF